jgi:hypothetical protein
VPCFFFTGPNMHDADSKCHRLASTIQAIFQEGLHVNQDIRHFIPPAVSISDVRRLEAFLKNACDCESDSLMELIYFPDESIQLRLEDLLESEMFQQTDEQEVLEQILTRRGSTLLCIEGLQSDLTITTPENGARAFLARLKISRHLDPELIGVIDHSVGKIEGGKYKVWLRNMVMDLHRRDSEFLKDLFLKMDTRRESFDEYVAFSLRFLEESRNDADLFQALTRHKNRNLRHLRKNDWLEACRRDHNIETLLSQGIRIPHMDKQTLLRQTALADDICLALFIDNM